MKLRGILLNEATAREQHIGMLSRAPTLVIPQSEAPSAAPAVAAASAAASVIRRLVFRFEITFPTYDISY